MLKVVFTDVDEFIQELGAAGPIVLKLLRVTVRWRRDQVATAVTVVATAVAGSVPAALNGGDPPALLRLDAPCGSYLLHDGADGREVRGRADEVAKRLTDAAGALGLNVRPGIYEAA